MSGHWMIQAEPHVILQLKRLFPKINAAQHGVITLKAGEESSRDLEWFCQRYPLEFEDVDQLERRARAFDDRFADVVRIMEGSYEVPSSTKMAKPPRDYQRQAAALCLNTGSLLDGSELGLGKTVTGLTMLSDPRALPAVVICPTHMPPQWVRKVEEFLPGYRTHIIKKTTPYCIADRNGKIPDVIVMNYHKVSGWADHLAGNVNSVIFDECQELRKGSSFKYTGCLHIARSASFRMGLSATPIYNYGGEFWNILNLLREDCLGSRHEFIREWCSTHRGEDKAALKDPKAFGEYIRSQGLYVRNTRASVERELPSLNRVVHEVECDQAEMRNVESRAMELGRIILGQAGASNFERMKAGGDFSMVLRQATGVSKAPFVAEFVRMLVEETGEPVLLFGWHRTVYDVWMEQLEDLRPAMFTGSESPSRKQKELDRFLDGDARVLMMSLRSGSGLDGLQGMCTRVVVGELDWSPGVIEQCVGRVHRDGQEHPVFVYYVVSTDGADPTMMDVLGVKKGQIEPVRDPDGPATVSKQVDPDHVKKLVSDYMGRLAKR